jgi:tryptophanyl-tRNA synthetase
MTGLRANGELHLGNFLGAIYPMVKRQEMLEQGDELYMAVVDLHSYVTPIDHSEFYDNVLNNIRWYVAGGIEPGKGGITLFRQSRVSAHTELAWHLSCFGYYGEVSRMTQFKDKSKKQEKEGSTISVGLFTYPVLMAADILLYDALYVPVGEDQRQHLELTRDVAIRINNKFEEQFPDGVFEVPRDWEAQLEFTDEDEGVRIRSLSKPENKMSKSVSDPKGTILLSDDPKAAAKKIMSATTDNLEEIHWDWKKQPGITNLLQIADSLEDKTKHDIRDEWEGKTSYGDLKKYVAGLVEDFLTDLQRKAESYSDREVEEFLRVGEIKANRKAEETLKRVRKALGLEK